MYTDHQIFDRYQRYKAKNFFAKSEQLTLKDLMSLKVGDYITHIDHGIGKFMGLVKVTNDGKTQECFKLTYKQRFRSTFLFILCIKFQNITDQMEEKSF